MSEERTTGKLAGAFQSMIYQMLYEVTLELSSSERDNDAIEERINTMIDAITQLAPADHEWDGKTKLYLSNDMVFEAELVLRLRPQTEEELE